MELTRKIIFAAAQDAGNRAMRAAGRAEWSPSDYDVACDEFVRLEVIQREQQEPWCRMTAPVNHK